MGIILLQSTNGALICNFQQFGHFVCEGHIGFIRASLFVEPEKIQVLTMRSCGIFRMESNALAALINLEKLDLGFNQLTKILKKDLSGLNKLSYLKIAHNRISRINYKAFDLPNLTHIDIESNPLLVFDVGQFVNLPHLLHLNLARTTSNLKFTRIEKKISILRSLDLEGNEIDDGNVILEELQMFPNLKNLHLTVVKLPSRPQTKSIYRKFPHMRSLIINYCKMEILDHNFEKDVCFQPINV